MPNKENLVEIVRDSKKFSYLHTLIQIRSNRLTYHTTYFGKSKQQCFLYIGNTVCYFYVSRVKHRPGGLIIISKIKYIFDRAQVYRHKRRIWFSNFFNYKEIQSCLFGESSALMKNHKASFILRASFVFFSERLETDDFIIDYTNYHLFH